MTGNNPRGRPHQADRLTGDCTTRAASGPGAADRKSSLRVVPVAFYGRTARTAGTCDSAADRYRQLALCRAAAAVRGAQVIAEFFDEDCRADCPWQDRPQGRSLLAALSGPDRAAAAVAVADPWRLLARRPAPEDTGILARLGFWQVQLLLADSGLVIASAEDCALLGTLLTSPACRKPPDGSTSWSAVRGHRARDSAPRRPAARLVQPPQ